MDYKEKYLKYKAKYLELKKKSIYVGGTKLTEFIPKNDFEKSLVNVIKANSDDAYVEGIYKPVMNAGEKQTEKFNTINTDIATILAKYPGNVNVDHTRFKNDTNSIVMIFETIVIKIFNLDFIKSKNHDELYNMILEKPNNRFFDKIISISINEGKNLYYLVSKKIDTKNFQTKLKEDKIKEQLLHDVKSALSSLAEDGWNQGDTSVDNIGYDDESKTFRLFDFGMATKGVNVAANLERDLASLNRSIEFNLRLLGKSD